MMRGHPGGGRVEGVSRNLMEPDPEATAPSPAFILWLCAFVLGVVVTLLRLAA